MSTRPSEMTREEFVARYGPLYESSPWVAEAAFDRGIGPEHDDPEVLLRRFAQTVSAAPKERQIDLLLAHPELGPRVQASLSADSRREQASAGLDSLDADQARRFLEYNRFYRQHFGFPFILAVKGMDAAAILAEFERRLNNDPNEEFAEALRQVNRIARLRLEAS